jgi:hypothetical protein
MTARHPVPDAALDDRLGFLGMTGSGKTFGTGTCVERILAHKGRVISIDPLGVWWGLRLLADGKTPSSYEIVIFGGAHADLPLTPLAGALIGETVATMRESAIIDLSKFETAASERRFMLAFLEALYRKSAGEPVHVIFDEADLFAPERILDKEGEATKLHGMMQTVVRRGRIKGLTSWLISQRPAALSKNVLSQVDGLIAFRLTASQDRKALGLWIEGQADREAGKAILGRLPEKGQGEAVVWLPARGILNDVKFPVKETYDSSRAPKRGEKRRDVELRPLDVGALKGRLATVEAEVKANDPKELKKQIAELQRQMRDASAAASKAGHVPDPKAIEEAEQRGRRAGYGVGYRQGYLAAWGDLGEHLRRTVSDDVDTFGPLYNRKLEERFKALPPIPSDSPASGAPRPARIATPPATPSPRRTPSPPAGGNGSSLTGPQAQLLRSLAWWKAMGHDRPTRVQVASIAGWRVTSGHLKNVAGSLRTLGLIDYPSEGAMAMTAAGEAAAPTPDTSATLEESVRAILSGPQRQVFDNLPLDGAALTREEIAQACGWEPTSGHVKNVLGSMRSLEVIEYPAQGNVARAEWLAESA